MAFENRVILDSGVACHTEPGLGEPDEDRDHAASDVRHETEAPRPKVIGISSRIERGEAERSMDDEPEHQSRHDSERQEEPPLERATGQRHATD